MEALVGLGLFAIVFGVVVLALILGYFAIVAVIAIIWLILKTIWKAVMDQ